MSPGSRLGWALFGLLVLALVLGGGAILADRSGRPVAGRPVAESGETVTRRPTATPPPPAATPAPPVRPGDANTVAGVGNERTIACDGQDIGVSGVGNTVLLTGACGRVDVSGVNNRVRMDTAATISVSGLSNTVTFRSGQPEISNSGTGNSVSRG